MRVGTILLWVEEGAVLLSKNFECESGKVTGVRRQDIITEGRASITLRKRPH